MCHHRVDRRWRRVIGVKEREEWKKQEKKNTGANNFNLNKKYLDGDIPLI